MRWFPTILGVFMMGGLFSQTVADWMRLGDEAMEDNDPYGALRYYQEAFALDSMKGSLIYRLGEGYRGVHNYPKAAYYYDKIYRRDRGLVFTDVGIKLAEMQMQAGEYEEAKKTWRRVRKDHEENPSGYPFQKAVQSMRSCDLARNWSTRKAAFELEPADAPVNSGDSEFAGIWLDDGSLSFTSLRGEYDEVARLESEVYFIRPYRTDTTLSAMEPIVPKIPELSLNYGNHAMSDQGMEAMVLIEDSRQRVIYLKREDTWEKLLPKDESDSSNYTHPAFARIDGEQILLFASDRPDGFGQYDIWQVGLSEGDLPVNQGGDINTPGNEVTPFYRKGESTLYFASDWHHGFGGFDLFRSSYFEGEFSFPENLNKPFSTPSNDLYYSFNEKVKKGSVTSNRVGPDAYGGCCNNLFYFEEAKIEESDTLPEITSLEELNKYLPVTLYFHNDRPDPRTRNSTTEKDYRETYRDYIKLLPTYRAEYRKGLSEREGDLAEEEMDEFFLKEVDAGLDDLALFTELLERELEEGNRIEITVKGFASPLAATDYNVNLTQRRISSLENYLKNYDRGALRPYLYENAENGGVLRLAKIPFGEYTADEFVSDNPNESNAIYGIAAAKERKIEIVSVSRASGDTALSRVKFDREVVDLATVATDDSLAFAFSFEVEDNQAFSVDSISLPSSIQMEIEGSYDRGYHEWRGVLFTGNKPGKRSLMITIYGNLPGSRKELNITFEVR